MIMLWAFAGALLSFLRESSIALYPRILQAVRYHIFLLIMMVIFVLVIIFVFVVLIGGLLPLLSLA